MKAEFVTRKTVSKERIESAGEAMRAAPERPSRTNLLLSASIESAGISGPVRIRNLSESGALLEGAALPPVGTRLVLRRLKLEIGATVIWMDRNRCGIRFEGTISVGGWREGNWIAPAGRKGNPDRLGGQAARGSDEEDRTTDGRIADELVALQQLIEDLGTALIEYDDEARRIVALQQFDIASQTLGHLADILRAPDRRKAIDDIAMESLRCRLLASEADRKTS